MKSRYALFFFLALIPYLFQSEAAPATDWAWAKLIGMAVYQGLLAMKALQSNPNPDPESAPPTAKLQIAAKGLSLILAFVGIGLLVSACATAAQKKTLANIEGGAATVLASPITQGIASFAAETAMNSLLASGMTHTSGAQVEAQQMAVDALTSGVTSAFFNSAAAGLRKLQGTNQAASAPAIAAQMADFGAPGIADSVAKAIPAIAATLPPSEVGPGNLANESIAEALDALAAKTKN